MGSSLEPVPITSQKHDPAWKHCQMFKNGERVELKCLYCGKTFKGGGIHRIKEHLAGQKGNASTCLRVPPDVKLLMQQSLDGVVVKKRKKQKLAEEILNINPSSCEIDTFANQCDVNAGVQLIEDPNSLEPNSSLLLNQEEGTSNKSGDRRKRGRARNALTADAVTTNNSIVLGSKMVNNHIHMAIGRFLYDIGAPLDAVNSVYFQPMIDAIVSGGSGTLMPSYHDLRGWILKNSVEEVKNDIDKFTETWGRSGCSILVDQWNAESGRTLLNILVSCPAGTLFLKSVDASDIVNSVDALYELLKQVVEEVGVTNVLQVITNGEEQYVVAGKRLTDTYPTLYWAPCTAHCLDLVLEDFGKLEWINALIEQARSITRFVYNHSVVLNMMRRYTFGNDIVEQGVTRLATNFSTLKCMVDLKHSLQAMVTSQEWMDSPYSKKPGGLAMLDLISNQSFWSSCVLITRLTSPLLRILGMVGSDKRPAMGYIYAGMYRAKEAIKKELVRREDYMVYWNIIDHRWGQQCQYPLHAAGFYLNPKFFYSIKGDMHNEIVSGMFDCIERLVPDIKVQDKIIKEINSYKNAVGDFGRKMAIRARDTLLPGKITYSCEEYCTQRAGLQAARSVCGICFAAAYSKQYESEVRMKYVKLLSATLAIVEWWSTYGGGCPNLARLAIRILGQTCSSIRCKRNQIPFEQIHNTKNLLEHQRLSDLVSVQYNLRLRQMVHKNKEHDSIDPISFDNMGIIEDWVAEKEVFLADYGSSDWMSLEPPLANAMILGHAINEVEDFGAGFDDYEILNRVKGEDNVEDNVVSQ